MEFADASAGCNREIGHVTTALLTAAVMDVIGGVANVELVDKQTSVVAGLPGVLGIAATTGWRWGRRSSCGPGLRTPPSGWSSSPDGFADAGAFLAFGYQDVMVAGIGIAPAEVAVQGTGPHGVLGWFELVMVNCRSGPKCASIGFAYEA
ncbi:hypothetical protein SALBM135S_05612 [Streptomyces alboniger]